MTSCGCSNSQLCPVLLAEIWGLKATVVLCSKSILFVSLPLRSSSMSPLATQPCLSTWTVTSPTGCTTPLSATPSPSSSSLATSTTRPTGASSLGATPPLPKQARHSQTGASTDSARPPMEQWWWGAKRRSLRRTQAGERGKEGLKEIRRRGAREVEVKEGLGWVLAW